MRELMDPEKLMDFAVLWGGRLLAALIVFYVGRWVGRGVIGVLKKLMKRREVAPIVVNFVGTIAKAAITILVVIFALDQLTIDTTGLVAVLGGASIGLSLALKDSLSSFAAGLQLVALRPFRTGDFIEAGGTSGVVERIELATTELRTPDNRSVVIPNVNIVTDVIINYSERARRRIDMVFGVGYDDDIDKARAILQRLLDEDDRILDDPAPEIVVAELADSSVNFFVRPWVKTDDVWPVRFDLIERVKKAFDEGGVGIPFPQMDVHHMAIVKST